MHSQAKWVRRWAVNSWSKRMKTLGQMRPHEGWSRPQVETYQAAVLTKAGISPPRSDVSSALPLHTVTLKDKGRHLTTSDLSLLLIAVVSRSLRRVVLR